MIDLRSLETFYVVAQVRGFHRAAEKLHTSQPAVSARIMQLEAVLNAKLFERDNRGSYLTAKGRELMVYAERMMNLRTELVEAMAGREGLVGTVRLGVSETIVHTWLTELLSRLNRDYRNITIEVSVDTSANLAVGLETGAIDVALLLGPIAAAKAEILPLCTYPISWVVSDKLDLRDGEVTLADLATFPILTFSRSTRPYHQLSELFRKKRLNDVRFFANTSLSSVIRMALDGIGVAAIPEISVSEYLSDRSLRIIKTDDELPSLAFFACHFIQPDRPLNAAVAELAQVVARDFENR